MKSITLERRELIWETRINTWTEKDWDSYKSWLAGFSLESATNQWARNNAARYENIKNITWDEVVADFKVRLISWKIFYGKSEHTEYLCDLIREAMREDNYDCDVNYTEYADDYDEHFTISPDDTENNIDRN